MSALNEKEIYFETYEAEKNMYKGLKISFMHYLKLKYLLLQVNIHCNIQEKENQITYILFFFFLMNESNKVFQKHFVT